MHIYAPFVRGTGDGAGLKYFEAHDKGFPVNEQGKPVEIWSAYDGELRKNIEFSIIRELLERLSDKPLSSFIKIADKAGPGDNIVFINDGHRESLRSANLAVYLTLYKYFFDKGATFFRALCASGDIFKSNTTTYKERERPKSAAPVESIDTKFQCFLNNVVLQESDGDYGFFFVARKDQLEFESLKKRHPPLPTLWQSGWMDVMRRVNGKG